MRKEQEFLELANRFLREEASATEFCEAFTSLWIQNRDAVLQRKEAWAEPYDQQLIAQLQAGAISKEAFGQQWEELWHSGEDEQFVEQINFIHSACSTFSMQPTLNWEISAEQLRGEVAAILAPCKK